MNIVCLFRLFEMSVLSYNWAVTRTLATVASSTLCIISFFVFVLPGAQCIRNGTPAGHYVENGKKIRKRARALSGRCALTQLTIKFASLT